MLFFSENINELKKTKITERYLKNKIYQQKKIGHKLQLKICKKLFKKKIKCLI